MYAQALLLSHPAPLTRDTQTFSKLREAAKTKKPGLKKLTELLLGVKIQAGGHSSVRRLLLEVVVVGVCTLTLLPRWVSIGDRRSCDYGAVQIVQIGMGII